METDYVDLAVSLGIQGVIVGGEFRAKCPIHNDNNPSFSMRTDNGLWICHSGCGSGDFYHLVEATLNCSPGEARDWIRTNGKRASVEVISKRLSELLNQSNTQTFIPPNMGWLKRYEMLSSQVMPMWFLNRGFTWDTIDHWGIKYDHLFDSIVIPVKWEGEIIGTVTRHTQPGKPKYENTEFKKSEVFFGEMSQKAFIILVEGLLDSLWLWQLGYNVVSILGSSLSQKQVDILKRFRYGEIILALDNDEAGINGTKHAVDLLTKNGWLLPQIKVISFPGKNKGEEYRKDAQDCTAEEFKWLFENRRDYLLW